MKPRDLQRLGLDLIRPSIARRRLRLQAARLECRVTNPNGSEDIPTLGFIGRQVGLTAKALSYFTAVTGEPSGRTLHLDAVQRLADLLKVDPRWLRDGECGPSHALTMPPFLQIVAYGVQGTVSLLAGIQVGWWWLTGTCDPAVLSVKPADFVELSGHPVRVESSPPDLNQSLAAWQQPSALWEALVAQDPTAEQNLPGIYSLFREEQVTIAEIVKARPEWIIDQWRLSLVWLPRLLAGRPESPPVRLELTTEQLRQHIAQFREALRFERYDRPHGIWQSPDNPTRNKRTRIKPRRRLH